MGNQNSALLMEGFSFMLPKELQCLVFQAYWLVSLDQSNPTFENLCAAAKQMTSMMLVCKRWRRCALSFSVWGAASSPVSVWRNRSTSTAKFACLSPNSYLLGGEAKFDFTEALMPFVAFQQKNDFFVVDHVIEGVSPGGPLSSGNVKKMNLAMELKLADLILFSYNLGANCFCQFYDLTERREVRMICLDFFLFFSFFFCSCFVFGLRNRIGTSQWCFHRVEAEQFFQR